MSTEKDYKDELVPGYFAMVELSGGGTRIYYHSELTLEEFRAMVTNDISMGYIEDTMEWTSDNPNMFRLKSMSGNYYTYYTKKIGEITTRERDAIIDIIVIYDSADKRLKDYISKTLLNENLF